MPKEQTQELEDTLESSVKGIIGELYVSGKTLPDLVHTYHTLGDDPSNYIGKDEQNNPQALELGKQKIANNQMILSNIFTYILGKGNDIPLEEIANTYINTGKFLTKEFIDYLRPFINKGIKWAFENLYSEDEMQEMRDARYNKDITSWQFA